MNEYRLSPTLASSTKALRYALTQLLRHTVHACKMWQSQPSTVCLDTYSTVLISNLQCNSSHHCEHKEAPIIKRLETTFSDSINLNDRIQVRQSSARRICPFKYLCPFCTSPAKHRHLLQQAKSYLVPHSQLHEFPMNSPPWLGTFTYRL